MGNKASSIENKDLSIGTLNDDEKNKEEYLRRQREYFARLAETQKSESAKDNIIEAPAKKEEALAPLSYIVQSEIKAERKKIEKIEAKPLPDPVSQSKKPEIDLEHVTLEKIFRVCIEKSKADKAKYLENYSNSLINSGKENKFRVSDLDNLILVLIETEKVNILEYFLTSYHRAYELIEVKYKQLLAEKFGETLRMIASYFSLAVTSPESFDLVISSDSIFTALSKYYEETSQDELISFLSNIYCSLEDSNESLIQFFDYIINFINQRNFKCLVDHKSSFFRSEEIKKNLTFIGNWLATDIKYAKVFSIHKSFLPKSPVPNSQEMAKATFLGLYFSLNLFDTDPEESKKYLSAITVVSSYNLIFRMKLEHKYPMFQKRLITTQQA